MTTRVIPGFSTISQFAWDLPSGMCGPTATLGALHNKIDPQGYQMDHAGLKKIYEFELAHGYCELDGAQDIYHLYSAVRALYPAGAANTRLVGYGSFNLATFHNDIHNLGGIRALVVEYANGQAFPGDENGLHFHFASIGGFSDSIGDYGFIGGYGMCDGDWNGNLPANTATPPVWRPFPIIAAAQPIAYVICAL